MKKTENIRQFAGPIIGQVTHKDNGDIELRKCAGPILGTYNKSSDEVKKFSGKIISSGCGPSALFSLLKETKP